MGLTLNEAAPNPLATCRLDHPRGGALLLGVLGASHVVVAEHGGLRFSEQVSCTAGGNLPERSEATGYTLRSHIEGHDAAGFRALARELRTQCAGQTGWLGGVFPGDDAALTALAAEPDGAGWRWRTWHLYPTEAGGMVVHTASRWHP